MGLPSRDTQLGFSSFMATNGGQQIEKVTVGVKEQFSGRGSRMRNSSKKHNNKIKIEFGSKKRIAIK